jgi:nitrilase
MAVPAWAPIDIQEIEMSMSLPTVRVAAIQAEPVVLDCELTVEKACRLIVQAGQQGARLIVFPELFITTHIPSSVWGRGLARFGEARAQRAWLRLWHNAVEVPGRLTDRLCRAAKEAEALVVMGLHEKEPNSKSLFNTLVFIGPQGDLLGKHRKLMPTNHERLVHATGDGSTLRVYDTSVGRIGGLICWENFMPMARFGL